MNARVLILALVLLGGCASTEDPSFAIERLDEPVEVEVKGDYLHERSRVLFPPSVADFRRVAVTRYDRGGFDISVGYDLRPVAITVHVYPATRSPAKELEEIERSILRKQRTAKLAEKGDYRLAQGGQVADGLRMRHRTDGGPDRITDTLLFRRTSNRIAWFVRFRITFPAAVEGRARPEIDRFLETLWLP